jgi:(p)ppGpp synthase/HD superfamily hydrolase
MTLKAVHPKYAKQRAHLRAFLIGKSSENHSWFKALDAFEFAEQKHQGQLRKDGVTPYFAHPIEATLYLLTLPTIINPLNATMAMLNHDVLEDTATRYQEMADVLGTEATDDVAALSKKVDGVKKGEEEYWRDMHHRSVATIGKPVDRINNQYTMGGTFSLEKQIQTFEVTQTRIMPMMKASRRRFPQQTLAYENAKLVLSAQLATHKAMLAFLQEKDQA